MAPHIRNQAPASFKQDLSLSNLSNIQTQPQTINEPYYQHNQSKSLYQHQQMYAHPPNLKQ